MGRGGSLKNSPPHRSQRALLHWAPASNGDVKPHNVLTLVTEDSCNPARIRFADKRLELSVDGKD